MTFISRIVSARQCIKVMNFHSITSHYMVFSKLHTSAQRNALPLALLIKPMAKLGAILTGRTIRRWWQQLPLDKRTIFISRMHASRVMFVGVGGVGVGVYGVYYYTHLERAPITGRMRFVAVKADLMDEIVRLETEQVMAECSEHILPANHVYTRRVKEITEALIFANQDLVGAKRSWKIAVVRNDELINAMCLPTGHVIVFTGLLKFVETDHQLAFVLAHEMSHVLLEHGRELVSRANVLEWVLIVCMLIIWTVFPSDVLAAIGQMIHKQLLNIMFQLPYNRQLEEEADTVGLEIMAKACFNVYDSSQFWELMDAMENATGSSIPEWLSTHPLSKDRASRISELIPKAVALRNSCGCYELPRVASPNVAGPLRRLADLVTFRADLSPGGMPSPGVHYSPEIRSESSR